MIETKNKTFIKFDKFTILEKAKVKEKLLKENNIKFNKEIPLICISYPLTEQNNIKLLSEIIIGIIEQKAIFIINGIGNNKYKDYFTKLEKEYPQNIILIDPNEKEKSYIASDMIILSSSSYECIEECKKAMEYGVIPISEVHDFLEDYKAALEQGNAFIFTKNSKWSLFAAFIKAYENFKFTYDWKNICSNAFNTSKSLNKKTNNFLS